MVGKLSEINKRFNTTIEHKEQTFGVKKNVSYRNDRFTLAIRNVTMFLKPFSDSSFGDQFLGSSRMKCVILMTGITTIQTQSSLPVD